MRRAFSGKVFKSHERMSQGLRLASSAPGSAIAYLCLSHRTPVFHPWLRHPTPVAQPSHTRGSAIEHSQPWPSLRAAVPQLVRANTSVRRQLDPSRPRCLHQCLRLLTCLRHVCSRLLRGADAALLLLLSLLAIVLTPPPSRTRRLQALSAAAALSCSSHPAVSPAV